MAEEYNFQKELKKSIFGVAPDIDKIELLTDIFKTYTAKLFEHTLGRKKKDRLEEDAMIQVKRNLINEFRKTELGEIQRSVEWYEDLFDTTIQEIFNDAALAHRGQDVVSLSKQNLEINPEAYIEKGGIFVPDHMKGA